MSWKAKKAYHKAGASVIPAGGNLSDKNPEATFVPDGVSLPTQKKHSDFHKITKHKPMAMRKPMLKGEF